MRRKKKKQSKINIPYLVLSLYPLAWLYFILQKYDVIQASILSAVVAIAFGIVCIAITMLKKEMKRKKYLSSSLCQIDKMNPYDFEELVGEHFRQQGYKVKQTPKAGDYGADLLMEKDGNKIAVQVKRYTDKVGNKAVQEVVAAMHYYKCDQSMVVTNSFYTSQAQKMAKECNVLLLDRNDLEKDFKILKE